jgi:hypothetical protein
MIACLTLIPKFLHDEVNYSFRSERDYLSSKRALSNLSKRKDQRIFVNLGHKMLGICFLHLILSE